VSLLSFQSLPKALYDIQIAFNATPAAGPEGKIDLQATEARVRRHYALLAAGRLPAVAIQLVHAPVFMGIRCPSASIWSGHDMPSSCANCWRRASTSKLRAATRTRHRIWWQRVRSRCLVRVRSAEDETTATNRFWLWAAADNLKLSAINAVACALEMRRLRPQGQVQ